MQFDRHVGKSILLIHQTRQFGRESKIILEYWWDSQPWREHTTETSLGVIRDDSLCLALQKLLYLAKHNYGTNKVYDNASGSNETVISSRVLSSKESAFRRPLIPQTYHKIGAPDAFKTQLDKFKTRFCKRGRTVRQKSLIVQRLLPITSNGNVQSENVILSDTPTTSQSNNSSNNNSNNNSNNPSVDGSVIQDDKITEVEEQRNKNFLPMDGIEPESNPKPTNSIITSATQILKEGEWLNSEVADFSLSSFLGQLESPLKGSQRSQVGGHTVEDVRPSSDVVSHMQCLMAENSVDYMAKFANLASQIADDEHKAQIL
ncbi:protein cramped [Vespula maculifrons]|uniref:Protein cramped n=1 Tax=Vespula maculifrons TaxID=7453 RepID=A0ABD2AMU3_VESMC